MADVIHDRVKNKLLRFSDVLQADVLLWLASRGRTWYPRCFVYGERVGALEVFLRATNSDGIKPLLQILDLNSPSELLQLLTSEDVQRTFRSERFWRFGGESCLNLDELQRVWNK
jgi:hypothetical protein